MAEKTRREFLKASAAPIVPRNWVEGPSAIKLPDRWIVYLDCYRERRYGAATSTDLVDWEDITKTIQSPDLYQNSSLIGRYSRNQPKPSAAQRDRAI
jgi:hypothetical protein